MIQTHQQLISVSKEYNTLFSKNEFYPLQKAYTTPHFLVFTVRFPGKTIALYIGRGHGYEGIFLSDKIPPSYLRIKDKLLDYVRKYLVGSRLGMMTVEDNYHVCHFQFKNIQENNCMSFGYKDHQLFFMKKDEDLVFTSWDGQVNDYTRAMDNMKKFVGEKKITSSSREWSISDYLQSEEKKNGGKPLQKKKEKFLERKLKNIEQDLVLVKAREKIEEDLRDEKIKFDSDSVQLHGHKIKFTGALTDWQKRDLVFQKIKKLKKAEDILTERLKLTLAEHEQVKAGNFEFELTKEKAIAPLWNNRSAQKKTTLESMHAIKNFKLKTINGVIALNAESNDWIRGQAAKEHWWFHIDQHQGSHLILKTDDISQLTPSDIAAVASMLRDHSKLEISSIPLVFCQVKHLKGMKGAQGKVVITKPKYLQCIFNASWTEIITLL